MPILPQPREHELPGDFARRKARLAMLVFLISLPASIWLFARLAELWFHIVPLEGGVFLLASMLFGAALAITPIVAVLSLLMAVWHGVESVYRPNSRSRSPLDHLIVGAGILVWFSPALALAGGALRAIITGSIAFSRPARVYVMATDPIAFWQGVGFLLIVAAALAYPAWHYWRGKFSRPTATTANAS